MAGFESLANSQAEKGVSKQDNVSGGKGHPPDGLALEPRSLLSLKTIDFWHDRCFRRWLRETAGSVMSGQKYEFDMKNLCETPLARGPIFFANGRRPSGCAGGAGMRLQPVKRFSNRSAFTLVETMMSILIIAMFFSTILLGYTRATQRAQWSGYALAAQAQGMKQLEEFRAVLWDTLSTPVIDNTTNIPTVLVLPLDLPISGSNVVYATNTATVTTISGFGNNAAVKMIVINTTWPWNGQTFTNTIVDYRSPDQ
jgi:type II secretory pathway pseudopilin PulG